MPGPGEVELLTVFADMSEISRNRPGNDLEAVPDSLVRQLASLAPSDPTRINLYLLAIAGDGTQEVFRREVDFVRNEFDASYGTKGRSLVLVNSRNTLDSAPMATLSGKLTGRHRSAGLRGRPKTGAPAPRSTS